jgi:hypothetical protein
VEHDLFRKPVSTPDQVRGRLVRDHALGVNFQEVVHSVLAVNAEVAKPSDSRRTEWTLTRMLL